MEKIYVIESTASLYGGVSYRFRSLFDSTIGSWNKNKEGAEEEGEKHQRIITQVYKVKEGKGYV